MTPQFIIDSKLYLQRRKDETDILKIVEQFFDIYKKYSTDKELLLKGLLHKTSYLYYTYMNLFYQAIKENNSKKANINFLLFAHSSILYSLSLSKTGDYEQERKVLDFFTAIVPTTIKVPEYIQDMFNNTSSENALRLAYTHYDNNERELVEYYLNISQDYLYCHIQNPSPEKLGELALFYFIKGNCDKSVDFLQMQYEKFQKDIEKLQDCEIINNHALFKRSQMALKYKRFVEDFILSKNT